MPAKCRTSHTFLIKENQFLSTLLNNGPHFTLQAVFSSAPSPAQVRKEETQHGLLTFLFLLPFS